jgi:hypothetical protein
MKCDGSRRFYGKGNLMTQGDIMAKGNVMTQGDIVAPGDVVTPGDTVMWFRETLWCLLKKLRLKEMCDADTYFNSSKCDRPTEM